MAEHLVGNGYVQWNVARLHHHVLGPARGRALGRRSAPRPPACATPAAQGQGLWSRAAQPADAHHCLMVAAGALPMFRHLLHIRGVYLDLETLIGT
ncbi:hypothetical protein [Streptomyces sp. uw30]|uniref:hypothetical protein n=1 Tax=Streptomyces sp. uw30 TaxID=1828179 RepID=UPI0016519B70|nr:hypothetical protein [Streptomyces sp. uw30]